MSKESYMEQLKTPMWRERKSEILKRDNYSCRICGAYNCEINVHHVNYIPYRMAWEYPNEMLVSLCKNCHNKLHDKMNSKELYGFKIGDLYSYEHTEYDNYGVIYDIDFFNEIIYFASIDNGGSYDTLYLEEFSINKFKNFNKIYYDDMYFNKLLAENINNVIQDSKGTILNTNYSSRIYDYKKQFSDVVSLGNDLSNLIKLVNGEKK